MEIDDYCVQEALLTSGLLETVGRNIVPAIIATIGTARTISRHDKQRIIDTLTTLLE